VEEANLNSKSAIYGHKETSSAIAGFFNRRTVVIVQFLMTCLTNEVAVKLRINYITILNDEFANNELRENRLQWKS